MTAPSSQEARFPLHRVSIAAKSVVGWVRYIQMIVSTFQGSILVSFYFLILQAQMAALHYALVYCDPMPDVWNIEVLSGYSILLQVRKHKRAAPGFKSEYQATGALVKTAWGISSTTNLRDQVIGMVVLCRSLGKRYPNQDGLTACRERPDMRTTVH
jgi:hypothetical protein